MDRGYIKLHRQLLNWQWADDPAVLSVWIHILLRAHWSDEPVEYRGTVINKGQCVVGRKELAAATGLSEQQVRTALSRLQSTSTVTTKPTSKGTLVTVENYTFYQQKKEKATSKSTSKRAGNQPLPRNKEVKEVKEVYVSRAREDTHAEPKGSYGIRDNVRLTQGEYARLCDTYHNAGQLIDKVSLWLTEHTRKDHYATCLTFARNDDWPKRPKPRPEPKELTQAERAAADVARDELMERLKKKGIGGATKQ